MPAKRPREATVWTIDQQRAFLDANVTDPQIALWRLLLDSGMRIGEALALRWSDLDGAVIHVRCIQTPTDGGIVISDPKTLSSRRAIDLEPETIAALKRHQTAQKVTRLASRRWQ